MKTAIMRKCFLCNEGGKIVSFSTEKLKTFKMMINYRKIKKFKYGDVVITPEIEANYGYHIECYRKLMVLKTQYKEEFQQMAQQNVLLTTFAVPSAMEHEERNDGDTQIEDITLVMESSDEDIDKITNSSEILSITLEDQPSTSHTTSENIEELREDVPSGEKPTKKKCIFCLKYETRVGLHRQSTTICQTPNYLEKMQKMAETTENRELLNNINNHTGILVYHRICRLNFEKKYQSRFDTLKPDENQWHETRLIHKEAFEILTVFLFDEVVGKERVFYLTDIFRRYKDLLRELASDSLSLLSEDFNNYTPQHLQDKILTKFGNDILITGIDHYTKRKIVYKFGLTLDKLLYAKAIQTNSELTKLQDVAFDLRHAVKNVQTKSIKRFQPDEITRGECAIPEQLYNFISYLVKGPDLRRQSSNDDNVKIKSICQDIICIITKGRVKPAKHLMLGQNNQLTPTSIKQKGDLSTHVAIDNHDRFVDTLSGKDTLHDTIGINNQFIPENNIVPDATQDPIPSTSTSKSDATYKPKSKKRRLRSGT